MEHYFTPLHTQITHLFFYYRAIRATLLKEDDEKRAYNKNNLHVYFNSMKQ